MRQKGQAAVEVLVYLGFFLLVFVSLSTMLMLQLGQDITQREYMLSQEIASQISSYIDIALAAGPGFNATFDLPPQITGQDYIINFTDAGSVYIHVEKGRYAEPAIFAFPLSTRKIELGCQNQNDDPSLPCYGNKNGTYVDSLSATRTYWQVNVSDGNITIANIADPKTGASILQVS